MPCALVEVGVPAGYDSPTSGYGMILYFKYEEGKTTEIFNDAFYIKEKTGSSPQRSRRHGRSIRRRQRPAARTSPSRA